MAQGCKWVDQYTRKWVAHYGCKYLAQYRCKLLAHYTLPNDTLEEKTLSDFVDLSAVLMQRFEQVRVEGDSLILVSDGKQRKLKIQRKPDLVSKVLAEKYRIGELKLTKTETSLYELTALAVIDSERQEELKDYIDHLVFALYFKVPLSKAYLEKQDYNKIKSLCSESEYYNLAFGP